MGIGGVGGEGGERWGSGGWADQVGVPHLHQPAHLCAPARHERRHRIRSKSKAFAHPRGDGDHVFHRAAHLDAHNVARVERAEVGGGEELEQRVAQLAVRARHRDRRHEPLGNLLGEGWAGEKRKRVLVAEAVLEKIAPFRGGEQMAVNK